VLWVVQQQQQQQQQQQIVDFNSEFKADALKAKQQAVKQVRFGFLFLYPFSLQTVPVLYFVFPIFFVGRKGVSLLCHLLAASCVKLFVVRGLVGCRC
jgi:hypothetical protein